MSVCEHYDADGRLAVERGEDANHCDVCRELAAADRGVQDLLRATAPEVPDGPSDRDWQFRVLAGTRGDSPRPRRRWLAAAAAALALAFAVTLAVRAPWRSDGLRITVDQEGVRAAPTETETVVARGATVTVRAPVGDEGHSALWIYLDERLELACAGACKDGDVLEYEFEAVLGTYDVLVVHEPTAPPDTAGVLNTDYAAARERGARIERERFNVR